VYAIVYTLVYPCLDPVYCTVFGRNARLRKRFIQWNRAICDRSNRYCTTTAESLFLLFLWFTLLLGSNPADFHSWLPSQESLSTHQGIRVHCNFLQNSQNNLFYMYSLCDPLGILLCTNLIRLQSCQNALALILRIKCNTSAPEALIDNGPLSSYERICWCDGSFFIERPAAFNNLTNFVKKLSSWSLTISLYLCLTRIKYNRIIVDFAAYRHASCCTFCRSLYAWLNLLHEQFSSEKREKAIIERVITYYTHQRRTLMLITDASRILDRFLTCQYELIIFLHCTKKSGSLGTQIFLNANTLLQYENEIQIKYTVANTIISQIDRWNALEKGAFHD
jgi:hypothetical protein